MTDPIKDLDTERRPTAGQLKAAILELAARIELLASDLDRIEQQGALQSWPKPARTKPFNPRPKTPPHNRKAKPR